VAGKLGLDSRERCGFKRIRPARIDSLLLLLMNLVLPIAFRSE
jgi:hypothetical protein